MKSTLEELGLSLCTTEDVRQTVFFLGKPFGTLWSASSFASAELFGAPYVHAEGCSRLEQVKSELLASRAKVELGKRLFGGLLELGLEPKEDPLGGVSLQSRVHVYCVNDTIRVSSAGCFSELPLTVRSVAEVLASARLVARDT